MSLGGADVGVEIGVVCGWDGCPDDRTLPRFCFRKKDTEFCWGVAEILKHYPENNARNA
jgi:hypothetical protein